MCGHAVGLALAIGFRNFHGTGLSGTLAGFLLGVLLLLIGAGLLLVGGKQVITVEPKSRRIIVEQSSRFGTKTKHMAFAEVADVHVAELGDKEGGSVSFHVVARLRNGKELALFRGFYEGRYNRQVTENRCERLRNYLQIDG